MDANERRIECPRPDHPALAEVEEALSEVARAEQTLVELKHEVNARVIALAAIADKNERLRVVRYLYWLERRIKTTALAAALLIEWDHTEDRPRHGPVDLEEFTRYVAIMRRMVGPIGTKKCRTLDCVGHVPIESRSDLDNNTGEAYCPACARCPERPVPTVNWHVARAEQSAELAAFIASQRRDHETDRAELERLKTASALGDAELVRLYQLMSRFDDF
jgi:hypothetical protein